MKTFSFHFKSTLVLIGSLFVFLAVGLFAKGLMRSMSEFDVPEIILNSEHYYDAILWVYVHMIVIGILIILLGISVVDPEKQKWISVFLLLITIFYTYLDFRSADWMYGNSLYKGESSLVPAFISLIVNMLFLNLAVSLFRKRDHQ